MNRYRIYYNQKSTGVTTSSFDMAYSSEMSWYNDGIILFIENEDTGEIRKYVVKHEK